MKDNRLAYLEPVVGNVSRETARRLYLFERRFQEWNRHINLMSSADLEHLWSRHIADSAQLKMFAGKCENWLDIGSGGGFPGMIIAIFAEEGEHIHLVESNRKKAAFLSSFAAESGVPASVHAKRIEQITDLDQISVVTARAVASLTRIFQLTERWLTGGSRGLFHKGRNFRAELEQCRDDWSFKLVEHVSRTDNSAVILEISNLIRLK